MASTARRATVIIPTFSDARFSRWTIESVRRQSVSDIEILILCDGSPPEMISFFEAHAKADPRISVHTFPKSPRTGEPYRDEIIRQKAGAENIFYCSHDDLWFEDHIAKLEPVLAERPFVHTLHTVVPPLPKEERKLETPLEIRAEDFRLAVLREKMLNVEVPYNFVGLTCAAHTRKAYLELEEGWTTTPEGIWTDLYMWRKFLGAFGERCTTLRSVTTLHFPVPPRSGWTEAMREEELEFYFHAMLLGESGRPPSPSPEEQGGA